MDVQQLTRRGLRVARLDTAIYEDVEEDEEAVNQAALLVGLSWIAAGIGSFHVHAPVTSLVAGLVLAALGWVLWIGGIWALAKYVLNEGVRPIEYWPYLRTVGFAAVPGIALLVGVVPGLFGLILLGAVYLWLFATTTLAVQQSLYYSDVVRSAIVVGVVWVIQIVAQGIIFDAIVGTPAA